MRRWRVVLSALLLGLLAGCVTDPRIGQGSSWQDRFKRLDLACQPNMVQIHVAVIEQPLGDRYLNGDLWGVIDGQVVELERKARLAQNGLRVGQVVGSLPGELHRLLTTERSCVNPRCRLVAVEANAALLLGPIRPRCSYQTDVDGQTQEFEMIQAQCQLAVTPSFTTGNQIRLRFTPKIEHGESRSDFRVAPDRSGFVLEVERASNAHPELAWEVSLAPNQYLVVGTTLSPPESLGCRWFVEEDSPTGPVQRLLVVRVSAPAGALPELPTSGGEGTTGPLPLALQAIPAEFRASAH